MKSCLHSLLVSGVVLCFLVPGSGAAYAATVSATLAGALSVDQTGSAGYTIPIEVPLGTAGMQPSLSLSYSSSGGNGMLGQGWSLQGLSTISRCPKTKAQDDEHGTVRYDSNDRFCLDGKRLVAISGTYGTSGAQYRTEIESFVKVYSRGTVVGGGPRYWEVWTKSGQKMVYGGTTSSRVEATGQTVVRQWKLNRVEDTVGNYLTVSYTEDTADGFSYPSRIDYSGHKQGSVTQAPYASVRFSYGTRHDDLVLMQGGYKVGVDQRLTYIGTYVGATLVSSYRLTYSSTGLPQPSRITSIQHCDGVGDCLPSVDLTWNGLGAGSVVSAEAMENVASSLDSYVVTGDFDGDGRVSFMSTSHPSGHSGFSPLVADYDGDGDSDIGWTLATRRGLYFIRNGALTRVKTGYFKGYEAQTGDFNGDGRADLVWTKASWRVGRSAEVALSGSQGMGTAVAMQVSSAPSPALGTQVSSAPSPALGTQQNFMSSRQCSSCMPLPWASAGHDQNVNEGEWVSLSGSVSHGSPSWSQVSGPTVTLSGSSTTTLSFRAPEVTRQTSLVFRLSGDSYGFGTATDTVTVRVLNSSYNPPANLSPPSSGNYTDYKAQVGDFNGDGLSDLAWSKAYNGGISVYVTLGDGSGSFGTATHTWVKNVGNYTDYKAQVFDFNGDGITDMAWTKAANKGLYVYAVMGEGDGTFTSAQSSTPGRTDNYVEHEPLVGDFNGDGVLDLAWAQKSNTGRNVYTSLGDGSGLFQDARRSNIESLQDEQGGGYSNFTVDHTQSPIASDFTGDGITDIAWRSWVSATSTHTYTATYTGFACYFHLGYYAQTCEVVRTSNTTTRYWAVHRATGSAPEDYGRVSTITSGLATTFRLEYASLLDSGSGVYTTDSGSLRRCSLPCRDIQAPLHVVSGVTKDHGSGLTERITYQYGGAKANLEGRGFIGFRWVKMKDVRTGVITFTWYRQDFPYIGQVSRSKRFRPGSTFTMGHATGNLTVYDSVTVLGEEVNTWSSRSLYGGKTKFPYISSSTAKTYELEDGPDNSAVTTITNSSSYDSYGNPTSITVTTTGAGGTFRKVTTNTYTNMTSNWHLGRLTCAKVRSEAPGETAVTRTSGFAYSSTTGLLTKEVVEPGSGAIPGCVSVLSALALSDISLTTTYLYDKYGNRRQATTSGSGIVPRSSTTVWGERASCGSVTANGRFPVSVSNALGHAAENWYSSAFGRLLQSRDANGLESRWEYDGFGRPIRTAHADGRQEVVQYRNCTDEDLSCPSRAVRVILTDRTGSASTVSYLDRRGLVVRTETEGFDGTAIYQDTVYDAVGQVVRKSRAYYAGETAQWSRYTYDKLNRVKSETLPNGSVTTMYYDGLVEGRIRERTLVRVSSTTAARTMTREYDALGRTVRTIDPAGNQTSFEYTEAGKRKKVTAANGSVTTRTFDLRGRMLTQTDPDRGTQTSAYNALGERVSQTNARAQTATFGYDLLGRLVRRAEPEGTTVWVYDATSTGKGRLAQVSGPDGYLRTHRYDAYGRPLSETVTIGGERFTGRRTYDSAGRVSTVTYPKSGLVVRHEYTATGYLEKVRKDGSCGTVYWTAEEVNAEGQVEESLLGNGVGTTRVFDSRTGLMQSIQSGLGETSGVQDLGYVFDPYGNLTSREDFAQGVYESFTYDGLNRLTSSTLSNAETEAVLSSKSYRYDAVGNMMNKSDVGASDYVYGTGNAGPHAVTAAGSHSYTYDASGNMVSGAGRTLTWTSFQKPRTMAKGSTTSTFEYGPGRKRTRQVKVKGAVTESITYVGGLYEQVEKTGSATEHVHYVFAGGMRIAVETVSEAADSNATLRYLHQDHLGSVDVVTDASGAVLERLSFGAFGERRVAQGTTAWQDSALALSSSETRRGFTDHEQLDDFGLVHMNGRVYDPHLGRFLSADPFVQSPLSSQGYNRYTYVNNNPLSFTDPSGYFFKKVFRKAKNLIKKVFSNKVVRIAATVAFAAYGGPAGASLLGFAKGSIGASVVGGFGSGLIASGGDLKSAIVGGLSGGALGFSGCFSACSGTSGLSVTELIVRGVVDRMFSSRSRSTEAQTGNIQTAQAQTVTAISLGGTVSTVGGTKFANGAMSGAFAYLYSKLPDRQRVRRPGEIYVTAHRVAGIGPIHVAVEYTGTNGTTIFSAGPENGNLVSELNRKSDLPGKNFAVGTLYPPVGVAAEQYVEIMLEADQNYCDCVDYDTFPEIMDGYNSASYISGLINATGGSTSVDLSEYIGGGVPLPDAYFRRPPR